MLYRITKITKRGITIQKITISKNRVNQLNLVDLAELK